MRRSAGCAETTHALYAGTPPQAAINRNVLSSVNPVIPTGEAPQSK